MAVLSKTDYNRKPREVIIDLAKGHFEAMHLRKPEPGEMLPNEFWIAAIINYLDWMYEQKEAK